MPVDVVSRLFSFLFFQIKTLAKCHCQGKPREMTELVSSAHELKEHLNTELLSPFLYD